MNLNVSKSAAQLTMKDQVGKRFSRDPKLFYQSLPFTGLAAITDTYTYLGCESGGDGHPKPTMTRLQSILEKGGNEISAFQCPSWMKTYFFIHLIIPKVSYSLQNLTLPNPKLEELNVTARRFVRVFEHKRTAVTCAFFHAPTDLGGLGLPNFHHTQSLKFTIPFLRRLLLSDGQLRRVEWTSLHHECLRLAGGNPELTEQLMLNPSEFCNSMDKKTPLDYTVPMTALAGVGVSFTKIGHNFTLGGAGPLKTRINKVCHSLKESVHRKLYDEWCALISQGSSLRAVPYEDLAPRMTNCDWQRRPHLYSEQARHFMQLCQTKQINCGTNLKMWKFQPSSICTHCSKNEAETTFHVLNDCEGRLHLYKIRHDAAHDVLSRHIAKLFPDDKFTVRNDIVSDRRVSSCTLRPDIVVIPKVARNKRTKVLIIDVKVPGATTGFAKSTHDKNVAHYLDLSRKYARVYGEAEIFTISIPSTGPNLLSTKTSLLEIGFQSRIANKILLEMSQATARASLKLQSTMTAKKLNTDSHV
jgi:hypothetical protein